MQRRLLFLLLFYFFGICVFGQNNEINFKHYSVNDGLSQSSVYSLFQDKTGFLWIGTADGLNKFDGYKFTSYKHSNDDEHSIGNNTIRGMLEDSAGKIWIGTETGLNVYDPLSDKISQIPLGDIKKKGVKSVIPLGFSGKELLCWRRSEGIISYNLIKKTARIISGNDSIIAESKLATDSKEAWYVRKGNVLCCLTINTKTVREFSLAGLPLNNITYGIQKDKQENILLCTSNGLWKFNPRKNMFNVVSESLRGKLVHDVTTDAYGNVYVAIENEGIYIYNHDWKFIKSFKNDYWLAAQEGFSLGHILHFFNDNSGNIWFGTDGDGLFKFGSNQIKFAHASTKAGSPFPLNTNFIKCFCMDDKGILWVGTFDHGLSAINMKTGSVKVYLHSAGNPNSLLDNTIYSIINDEKGLWLGTEKGMCFFDFGNSKFTFVKQGGLPEDRKIFCAYKTDNGDIVVSSNGRLFKLIKDKIPRLEEITTTFTVKNIAQNGNDLLLGLDSYGFNIFRDGKTIIPEILKSKRFERSSFQSFYIDKKIIYGLPRIWVCLNFQTNMNCCTYTTSKMVCPITLFMASLMIRKVTFGSAQIKGSVCFIRILKNSGISPLMTVYNPLNSIPGRFTKAKTGKCFSVG